MSQEIARDQEMIALRNEANAKLFEAEEVAKIATPEDERRATEYLAEAKRFYKSAEAKRKSWVAPLKEVIDNINATFKAITDPLDKIEEIVKKGMIAYRNSEEMKQKEAERLEAERAARIAVNNVKREGVNEETMQGYQVSQQNLQEASKDAPRTVKMQAGSASFRKETKFEIVDGSKLPARVNEAVLKLAFEKGLYEQVIRGMIKVGHKEIEGVRIWEESVPVIRT